MDIASYIKSMLKTDSLSIDNFVFRLHYRVTVAILLASSIIGFSKQYFGDPINCQTSSGVESKVLDDYCWIHSTFHLRAEYQVGVLPSRSALLPGHGGLPGGPGAAAGQGDTHRPLLQTAGTPL